MKLTIKQKVSFGIGAIGKDMVYSLVSGFILYYYNTILGISGTFTGIMMMAARVFDAFNDPLMGVVVEKTNTRFGKFRPWIFTGTVTNALILYGMFAMPRSLQGTPMEYDPCHHSGRERQGKSVCHRKKLCQCGVCDSYRTDHASGSAHRLG